MFLGEAHQTGYQKDMHKALKVGLLAGLIAPTLLASLIEPALAKKAPAVRKESPIFYRSWHVRAWSAAFLSASETPLTEIGYPFGPRPAVADGGVGLGRLSRAHKKK